MSGDKDNKGIKGTRAEIRERFDTERFVTVQREKLVFNGGLKQLVALGLHHNRPEFDAERRIFNDIRYMYSLELCKGLLAGLASFTMFRLTCHPQVVVRVVDRVMKRRRTGVGTATASKPANPFHRSSSEPSHPFRRSTGYKNKVDPVAPTGQVNAAKPGLLSRIIFNCSNFFFSYHVFRYFHDMGEVAKISADVPLVEGRSLAAEELCGDFMREFRKSDRRAWDDNHPSLSGPGSAPSHNVEPTKTNASTRNETQNETHRNAFLSFVANCQRRAIYEDRVRKERGAGHPDDPIVVPSPGVPRDIAVSLDDLLEETETGGDEAATGSVAGGEYFDTYFGTDNDQRD